MNKTVTLMAIGTWPRVTVVVDVVSSESMSLDTREWKLETSSAIKLDTAVRAGDVWRLSFINAEAISNGALVRDEAISSHICSTSNPRHARSRRASGNAKEA